MSELRDRVGLGWRGELAAAILDHLDAIDVLEVIAEEWTGVAAKAQRTLRSLGEERPVILHGVAMGIASSHPVETRRVDAMARLFDRVRPEAWSEHLAFVRAGGFEVGHLAAPPRTSATVDGALANIARAAQSIGTLPALENIATLIDPPASDLDEGRWTRAIVAGSGAPLLLDLHNLNANALNFGREPVALLGDMPLERVKYVHLSGGRWLEPEHGRARLLDDHLHDVPSGVFVLLEELAARAPAPLTVILERDGNFGTMDSILGELGEARAAIARGRARSRVSLTELAAA